MSLSGAIPHVGGKGKAFVFYIGRIISFLAAGRITPKVIICKAHLSLLEIALFCFLFFLCLLVGISILALSEMLGCLFLSGVDTLSESVWKVSSPLFYLPRYNAVTAPCTYLVPIPECSPPAGSVFALGYNYLTEQFCVSRIPGT